MTFRHFRVVRPFALLAVASLLALPARSAVPSSATHWSLDNTASVGGHTATVLGAPHAIRDQAGPSVVFDGSQDGLVLETNPLAGLTQFTIEVHFRPDADGKPEQRFFHIQDAAGSRMLMEIRLTPEKQWALDTFLFRADSQLALLDRAKLHSAGEWHWVTLRYDGKRMSSFVDGQPELAGDVSFGPMQASGQTSLGVRLNKVYWFKGSIGEVRIHSTALPLDQLSR